MPEAYWAAIATLVVMQSTLGATLTLSLERIVGTAVGVSVGALEAKLLRGKSGCVRGCNRSPRFVVDLISLGENCLSLRKHYSRNHRSHSAFGSGLDHCVAQVP
jgi:hypothetical protein